MLELDAEIVANLNDRTGVKVRHLFWVTAKNRDTGEPETMGLWTGDDHRTFTVDGDERTYLGAGGVLTVGDLVTEATLNIREMDVQLSPVATEVIAMLRLYDPRFAPAEIHLVFFDPLNDAMLAAPVRIFKGWVNKTPIKRPTKGARGSAVAKLVGHTRMLTRKLGVKRSNEDQKRRDATDTFFIDVGMTGNVQVAWGSKLEPSSAPPIAGSVLGNVFNLVKAGK